MFLTVCVLVVSMLAGCSGLDLGSLIGEHTDSSFVDDLGTDRTAAVAAESDLAGNGARTTAAGEDTVAASSGADDAADAAAAAGAGAGSVAEALLGNAEDHADAEDDAWGSSESVDITLDGDAIATDGEGVTVEGSTAIITAAGTLKPSWLAGRWPDCR
jgi:hypothetical protein